MNVCDRPNGRETSTPRCQLRDERSIAQLYRLRDRRMRLYCRRSTNIAVKRGPTSSRDPSECGPSKPYAPTKIRVRIHFVMSLKKKKNRTKRSFSRMEVPACGRFTNATIISRYSRVEGGGRHGENNTRAQRYTPSAIFSARTMRPLP